MLKDDEIIEKLDKRLQIIQKNDGYKYGEDTILLFKLFQESLNKKNIKLLDIGTGNGILPILLSDNEFLSELIGIDIQRENIERAIKALELNKIRKNVIFECMDIKEYKNSNYFDVIISNPPYMEENGKKINENEHKAISRHEIKLTLSEFISNAKRLLKPIGSLYFIHRTHRLVEIVKSLDKNNFSIKKIIFIYSTKNNKSSMVFIEAIKGKKVKLEVENYYI
ncbi:tRNA1(Val) (adenine(37)-N6)-methyltransferase [Fusobacterium hwasookii]|uniref:Ribosomal RNA small subunit methyltransferase C n=1 Tax=Fusobacterium hwasookii ChDC F128 TaxID=1216362 RepID=A0ABN0H0P9_9FUSO|nr:methyltransferase [Fusobacterium hwasookii]EJU07842.1 ribosomal RNA small subunit methyltransferase C [Fusobacterium hwasookii ChDC F128]QNE67298.1 methyltransferase domain-containing protein [Fusobacterium hwasookii]